MPWQPSQRLRSVQGRERYEDGARGTPADPHTFDLVMFSSYEITERALHLGKAKHRPAHLEAARPQVCRGADRLDTVRKRRSMDDHLDRLADKFAALDAEVPKKLEIPLKPRPYSYATCRVETAPRTHGHSHPTSPRKCHGMRSSY